MQPSENLPNGSFLSLFGGSKAEARPDPIPNSAVKLSVADGSACIACARVGCRLFFLLIPLEFTNVVNPGEYLV